MATPRTAPIHSAPVTTRLTERHRRRPRPDQAEQVVLILDRPRPEPVPEQPSHAPVPAVEGLRVRSENPLHRLAEQPVRRSHHEVEVVAHERPREHLHSHLAEDTDRPEYEPGAIEVIAEQPAAIDPLRDHVQEDSQLLQASDARHPT